MMGQYYLALNVFVMTLIKITIHALQAHYCFTMWLYVLPMSVSISYLMNMLM